MQYLNSSIDLLLPADNYNHLHEAPLRLYTITLTLAILHSISDLPLQMHELVLAWAYVGLRVVHSLVHALTNPPFVRFLVFSASEGIILVWFLVGVRLVF